MKVGITREKYEYIGCYMQVIKFHPRPIFFEIVPFSTFTETDLSYGIFFIHLKSIINIFLSYYLL